MELSDGLYFFHVSFLKEVSETWLSKRGIEKSAKLFIGIVSSKCNSNFITCNRTMKELITCDRTIAEISKPKYVLKDVPGYIDLITEKSLPSDKEITDNNLYSLRVASFNRIVTIPTFFIVSDAEKQRIKGLALTKKYTLHILSPEDFEA